jgi:hypothetical protein
LGGLAAPLSNWWWLATPIGLKGWLELPLHILYFLIFLIFFSFIFLMTYMTRGKDIIRNIIQKAGSLIHHFNTLKSLGCYFKIARLFGELFYI